MLRLIRIEAGAAASGERRHTRRADAACAERHRFFALAAVLFAASAVITVFCAASMPGMDEAPMPGGWTLSMAWMPMCGSGGSSTAADFIGMWLPMMAAMMLPSLTPMLWRYREALRRTGAARPDRLAVVAGLGYFAAWMLLGVAVFAAGAALAGVLLRHAALARQVPIAAGVVVLIAGMVQLSAWKARRLADCRCAPTIGGQPLRAAWRHGLRLGSRCIACCANLTAVLLVAGVMDLRAMALLTAAISAERLAAHGPAAARGVGIVVLAAGAFLIARAAMPA